MIAEVSHCTSGLLQEGKRERDCAHHRTGVGKCISHQSQWWSAAEGAHIEGACIVHLSGAEGRGGTSTSSIETCQRSSQHYETRHRGELENRTKGSPRARLQLRWGCGLSIAGRAFRCSNLPEERHLDIHVEHMAELVFQKDVCYFREIKQISINLSESCMAKNVYRGGSLPPNSQSSSLPSTFYSF